MEEIKNPSDQLLNYATEVICVINKIKKENPTFSLNVIIQILDISIKSIKNDTLWRKLQ